MVRLLAILSLAVLVITVTSGCRRRGAEKDYDRPLRSGEVALQEVPTREWPSFQVEAGSRQALLAGIQHSLSYLGTPTASAKYPVAGVSKEQVVMGLSRFAELLESGVGEAELNRALRDEFRLYRSVGWDGQGVVLFTGYYTPIFRGSKTRSERYRFPLYRRPNDLEQPPGGRGIARQRLAGGGTRAYPSRGELERSGVLAGTELAWLPTAMDAYIIQVQGSAKIQLDDGNTMEIGWAGDNGHDYVPIRTALVQDGQIPLDHFNLATLRAWSENNPQLVEKYTHSNPRYVFFTEAPGGPFGSLGRPVTADVSIATDKRIFPPGSLTYVETKVGQGKGQPYMAFRLDQDTGGAIRAPGRCDLYMGEGLSAERRAGYQLHEGYLYYLVIR
ncbi:MAG: MltA domain-containing protein [Planctomycetota bacterium]|jgi:membrane-bound lytic murein transglycosylase A|nr:MltA domain-containing protein [Planctomycetota bacterium]